MRAPVTAVCAVLLASGTAAAGGMTLPTRGVRATARAGAFVAGADDASALWLNPAGIAHLTRGGTLLFDLAYVDQRVEYERIDSGGNLMPAVRDDDPGNPIPTLAATLALDDRLVIAGGIAAPYAGSHHYQSDGTQRYGSVSLQGSTFVTFTAGIAYRVTPRLRIGVTVQNTVSSITSQIVLSGCPGQTICAPEDPEFDSFAQVQQTDLFAPSAAIGVALDVHRRVTIGVAAQSPTWIDGEGTLETRMPSSGFFDGASVSGDRASLSLVLPPVLRAGVELAAATGLRIEAALTAEFWSIHDSLDITPHDVSIVDAAGVGVYELGPMQVPRDYHTSIATSLGGELTRGPISVQAGLAYETDAAPDATVSVMTVDAAKYIGAAGAGYQLGAWSLGVAASWAQLVTREVTLAEAAVPILNPLRDQPEEIYINAGTYRSHYVVVGVRAAVAF